MGDFSKKLSVGQKIFILPLFFVATLIGVVVYTVLTLNQQSADSTVINIAGRQRMLTQKFTKELLDELNTNQVKAAAQKITEVASEQVVADRQYYTKHVVGKLKRDWPNFRASVNHKTTPGTIPFPATYVQEVSAGLGASAGYGYTLKSKWNINPEKGLRDGFESKAWGALSKDPTSPFVGLEKTDSGVMLHYATADTAKAGCVSCHNGRSDSPKRDFIPGELMGILVVSTLATSDAHLAKALLAGDAKGRSSDKTAELFEVSLSALREGGVTYSDLGMKNEVLIPGNDDEKTADQLQKVADQWAKLKAASIKIRKFEVNSKAYLQQLGIIRDSNVGTLKSMNVAVGMLAGLSSAKIGTMMTAEWIILVVALTIGFWVSLMVTRSITKPLAIAVQTTASIAAGDLDEVIVVDSQDETGQLLEGLRSMQARLSTVIEKDIQSIIDAARDGNLSQRVDLAGKDGFYEKLSMGVNELVDVSENVIDDTVRVFSALSRGDLSQQIESEYKGSFDQLKQDANATIEKIKQVIEGDIQSLVNAARAGDLSQRIDLSDKRGFFSSLSSGINELVDTVDKVFVDVSETMASMAEGDLTHPIERIYQGSFDEVKKNINKTMLNLERTVSQLRDSGELISSGAEEISSGNTNLSGRTEQQASSLEETASSMEELTSTVSTNADNAQQANQLASSARQTAQTGGEVVEHAAVAMKAINDSSRKIAEIISVIDEIAFQTNLLALNASVEAARAGEQGRGFAVVATEVRNLAGRSATAAKEIKELINDSVEKVDAGSALVTQSGENLDDIVDSVKKVSDIVSEIAAASQEQTAGIGQVNQAVSSMDEVTQQNAALAEQTSAAAASMTEKAREMVQLMDFFTITGGTVMSAQSRRPVAAPTPKVASAAAAPKVVATATSNVTAISSSNESNSDEWEEF